MLSLALLVVFLVCGLVYARASKQLHGFEKLRIEAEKAEKPNAALQAALQFTRRMGIALAPGNDELKAFCEKQGFGAAYKRANQQVLGSIAVALLCAFAILRIGPQEPVPSAAKKPSLIIRDAPPKTAP